MITKQKIKKLIIILILMIIFTLSLIFYNPINSFLINVFSNKFNVVTNRDNVLVHFINVGQADAAAINLPDGKVMLIDTGSKEVNTTYINYLKENVIHTKFDNYIDYLVLSHADMDHVGGTMKLLKNFKVGTIFMPKMPADSNGYAEILKYVQLNCSYQKLGDEFVISTNSYAFKFFESLNSTNTNDSSQVIKFECGDKSFLFVGDISSSVDQLYVSAYKEDLDVDVLKVSHHGANNATSSEFLNCVTPEYAVISVGENVYGHPSFEVVSRLENQGVEVLRTDKQGNVLFVVGEHYNLKLISGNYWITSLYIDYSYMVFVLDVVLLIVGTVIVIKKEKKNKHVSGELLV